jgi:hypothetical protein
MTKNKRTVSEEVFKVDPKVGAKYKGMHDGRKKGKKFQEPVPIEKNKKGFKKLSRRLAAWKAEHGTKPGSLTK